MSHLSLLPFFPHIGHPSLVKGGSVDAWIGKIGRQRIRTDLRIKFQFLACYIILGWHIVRNNDDQGILITTFDGLNADAAETIQPAGLAGVSRHSLRFFCTGE